MNITVFDPSQPRHVALIERLAERDADKILSACAPDFQFGDLEKGPVLRKNCAAYFKEFEQTVGRAASGNFVDMEGEMAFEAGDELVASYRWTPAPTHT